MAQMKEQIKASEKIQPIGCTVQNTSNQGEDGGEIGGSRVHFTLHMGEKLADLLRNRVNSQQYPTIYED